MVEQQIEDCYEKIMEIEYRIMFPDADPTPQGGESLSVSGYLPKGYGNSTVIGQSIIKQESQPKKDSGISMIRQSIVEEPRFEMGSIEKP